MKAKLAITVMIIAGSNLVLNIIAIILLPLREGVIDIVAVALLFFLPAAVFAAANYIRVSNNYEADHDNPHRTP